ncbi:MAG: Predicted transcriptional regulators, partial [uncultured Actinomycetospora sp.]
AAVGVPRGGTVRRRIDKYSCQCCRGSRARRGRDRRTGGRRGGAGPLAGAPAGRPRRARLGLDAGRAGRPHPSEGQLPPAHPRGARAGPGGRPARQARAHL